MSSSQDPGTDPRLQFDTDTGGMFCVCAGAGVVTDAADVGGGWWLVTWLTQHRPGCMGLAAPERAYLVDADAFAAGDIGLPGVAAEEDRLRRCEAIASTTGRRCRNRAGPGGLCGVHEGRRP